MKHLIVKLQYCLIILFFAISVQGKDSLRIQYIGNMGVLIEGRSSAVLIDGLHRHYRPAYQHPSAELVQELTRNQYEPPINILLNTHIHRDHFDANLVRHFLIRNQQVIFAGPEQAILEIANLGGTEMYQDRLNPISGSENKLSKFTHQNVRVQGFFLRHINPARHSSTINIGYLITIDGLKILHAGDTDWNGEIFKELNFQKEEIDIAILPNWMVMTEKGATIVKSYLKAKRIIVTHISQFEHEEVRQAVKKYFPDADLFTKIGQELVLEN